MPIKVCYKMKTIIEMFEKSRHSLFFNKDFRGPENDETELEKKGTCKLGDKIIFEMSECVLKRGGS